MVRPSFLLIPIIIGTSCALEWEKGGAFDNKTHFFPLTAYYGIGILLNLVEQWETKYRYCYISVNDTIQMDYCQHACVLKVTFSLDYNQDTKRNEWSNETSYHCQDIDTYPPKYYHVCSNMDKPYPNLRIYFNKRTFKKTHLYCCDGDHCNHPGAYQPIEAVHFKQSEHQEMQHYDLALFTISCLVLVVLVIWPFFHLYKVAKRDEWVIHAFHKRIEKAVVLMEFKPMLAIDKTTERLVSGQLAFNELVAWFMAIKDYESVVIPRRRVHFPPNQVVKVIDHGATGHGHELVRANRKTWVRYDDTLQPERATMQTVLEHGPYAYDWKPIDLVELFDQAKECFQADEVLVEISLPVVVIGDLRGHYTDLWRWLQLVGVPPTKKLLFLGGVIDPDEPGSLDTLALISVMKVAFPNHVFLLRGVPESMKISFGARYGETNDAAIQSAATRLCAHLPIACRIHCRILAVHSGISHLLTDYESFAEVKRPFDLEEMPTLARQLIFNEPTTRIKMYREDADTEIGHFGFQAVDKLCKDVKLNYIIRSRHHVDNGIMWNENGRLINLWSAPGKVLGEKGEETTKVAKYGAILELEVDENMATVGQKVYRITAQLRSNWSSSPVSDVPPHGLHIPDSGVRRVPSGAMEPDSVGSNKTRFLDVPILRLAILKWNELYGSQSEVFLNFLIVILVIVFVSYQCHQLLTRDNKLSRLRKRNEQVGKERYDKSTGEDEYFIDLHEHFTHVGQVVHRCYSPSDEEALRSSQYFYERMKGRRSQRVFSDRSVPIKVLTNLIKTAGTAPSACHSQPWTYLVVLREDLRLQIRGIMESYYCDNYKRLNGIDEDNELGLAQGAWDRAYISEAPALIILHGPKEERMQHLNSMSTTISVGLLLAAAQHVGLATVVTWPGNSSSTISKLLRRPDSEEILFLLPVGYTPGEEVAFPDLHRKPIENIIRFY